MTINISSSVHAAPLKALYRGMGSAYADSVLRQQCIIGSEKSALPSPVMPGEEGHRQPVEVCSFMVDYLAYNLLRKTKVNYLSGEKQDEDQLVEKAVSGFLEVEGRCRYFNKHGYIPGTAPSSGMLAPELVFHEARRKIAQVLGVFDAEEFAASIDFSNGASTRLPKAKSSVPVKFTGKPHVTRNCALLAVSLIWYNEPWRLYCQGRFGRESDPCTWVEVVDGSEYFTVPKTFQTLRGAAKEPELNMLCQKALGSMVRRRLKRVRIDLDDQTHNQYLAMCGSRTGALATVDLEAASDSVSLRLVEDLLPHDWYRFFSLTRSEKIQLPDGTWHTLEKVSSMGNGFTFELESLIFWAITRAVVDLSGVEDRRIGVYGDDIIAHHSVAQDLLNCLTYCGFIPNQDKTWVSGPFRESCGLHCFLGFDVTPFFIKEDLDLLENRYHLVNNLNEWLHRFRSYGPPEELMGSQLHDYVVRKFLSEHERMVLIPPHMDSKTGIYPPSLNHVPGLSYCLDKSMWQYSIRLPGHLVVNEKTGKRVWKPGPKTKHVRATPNYLTWHLKAQAKGCGGEPSEVAIHGERVVWRVVKRYTSMWHDHPVVLPKSLAVLCC